MVGDKSESKLLNRPLIASLTLHAQTTPLIAGLTIAGAAYLGKHAVQAYIKMAASGGLGSALFNSSKSFYKGGFQPEMNRREAALILGLRETAAEERIKDAHRRIMVANHPDSGGSSFIAAKVNEAKDILLGKKKTGSSMM
jgi:DnaJ family protein C protein 19